LAKNGAAVAVVSVDPLDVSRKLVEDMKLPYPILRDADLAVSRRYAGLHPKGGPGETDIPRPTTLIIGKDGKVRSISQYSDARTRPDPEDLIRVIKSPP
jgi:peroxiredoxin